jgi:hypothetical protein
MADLLLELLGHEDMTVGVMASQILMELHMRAGTALERAIQQCPDGMTKLLQLLPVSAREEVRNQALTLLMQLTAKNEEMKKTLAFNEGFEVLFRIIGAEGGPEEGGLVVQDCLRIVQNILTESETCQRLFYGGGTGEAWQGHLGSFFAPLIETYVNTCIPGTPSLFTAHIKHQHPKIHLHTNTLTTTHCTCCANPGMSPRT